MRRALLTAAIHVAVSIASFSSPHVPVLGAGSALARISPDTGSKVVSKTVEASAPRAADAADQPPSLSTHQLHDTLMKLAAPEMAPSKAEMCETLATAARQQALPLGFFVRLILQESDFDPKAVSPVGAQGVAQFMPETAQEWGLADPFDPHAALRAAARFLHALHDQLGNWGLAAAAYNAGLGRIQKWLDQKSTLPEETQHYVLTITGVPAEKWKDGLHKTDFTIPPRAPCRQNAPPAAMELAKADIPLPRVRAHVFAASDKDSPAISRHKTRTVADAAKTGAAGGKSHGHARIAANAPAQSSRKSTKEARRAPHKSKGVRVADAGK